MRKFVLRPSTRREIILRLQPPRCSSDMQPCPRFFAAALARNEQVPRSRDLLDHDDATELGAHDLHEGACESATVFRGKKIVHIGERKCVESYREHLMARNIQFNCRTGIFVISRCSASIGNSP